MNQQDRVTLKNLATWLGSITLARDKPIKHRNLSIKDLLIEGYDHQRLLVVIPFACKVLEAAARSTIFRPPNPWIMAIFGLLVEMFHCAELKIQLKFEIELLLKAFGLERADVEEAHILRNRPQEVSAGELVGPEGVGVGGDRRGRHMLKLLLGCLPMRWIAPRCRVISMGCSLRCARDSTLSRRWTLGLTFSTSFALFTTCLRRLRGMCVPFLSYLFWTDFDLIASLGNPSCRRAIG
jgi:hypothetical protein